MAWHPFRNVGLKMSALCLGTLLWLTVSGHEIERRVSVAVSYSNVPSGFEITGDQLDDATVRIRGAETAVSELGAGNLHVIVDLTDAHEGTNLLPLRTDQVAAPLDVEVLQLEPSSVTLTLERAGREQIEVSPIVEGRPAAGYAIGGIIVEPRTVTVLGPVSRLERDPSVVTERIDIGGRVSTMAQDVSVGVSDSQLRLGDTRSVRVTVRIEPAGRGVPARGAR
jgi:YbbR domain-containing protein